MEQIRTLQTHGPRGAAESPEIFGNMRTQIDRIEQVQMNQKRFLDGVKVAQQKAHDNNKRII